MNVHRNNSHTVAMFDLVGSRYKILWINLSPYLWQETLVHDQFDVRNVRPEEDDPHDAVHGTSRDSTSRRSPRHDSRRCTHRPGPDASRHTPPSTWNGTATHWDTNTEYGLNLPKRVEATQFSRWQNLAGQEITQVKPVKLVDVVQSGLSNWGLRVVSNGRFVSCEFFRNRMEATFATMLFREMSKQKDAIDFTIQIHMDHHGPGGHSHPSCTCAWICLLPTFTLVPQIIQFSIENRVEFENTVNFVINN